MRFRRRAGAWVLLALAGGGARAEEFAVFTGATDTDDHTRVSYSWALEYRQPLRGWLDLSVGYLNEGHVPGHHRDGVTAQIWAVSPLWRDRVNLALGFGPYFYFDTEAADSPAGFQDYHGVGAIVTASLSYYFAPRWFLRLNLSEVHTPGDEDTRTLVLGVGHTLDTLFERFGGFSLEGSTGGELGLLVGQTIDNSATSPRSRTFGLEYRHAVARNLELSGGWLNEGDGTAGSHNGLLAQVWLLDSLFNHRASLSLGAGPYVALERRVTSDGATADRVEGMVSLSLSWRIAHGLVARFTWDRGFTNVSQDRDIVLLGFGWHFGR